MGRERYVVRLKEEERDHLERLIRGGMSPARKVARARILLKADTGWVIERIMEALDTSAGTVCRTKRRYQATWQRSSSVSWPGESCAGASPMKRPSVSKSRPWRLSNILRPDRITAGSFEG